MKKKHIIALVVGIMILLGIIIGIVIVTSKKDNADKDYKVHETDDDTVEIESENGLKESDSEDGPILDEDNIIDFNGGNFDSGEKSDKNDTIDKEDDKTDVTPDKDGGNEDYTEEPPEGDPDNPGVPEEPEVPETGAWGTFY